MYVNHPPQVADVVGFPGYPDPVPSYHVDKVGLVVDGRGRLERGVSTT